MIFPPTIMRLRVRLRVAEGGRRKVSLWLPVILLWPLGLLAVLLAPLAMLVAFLRYGGRAASVALIGPRILVALCSLRGLSVQVQGAREQVHIAFW